MRIPVGLNAVILLFKREFPMPASLRMLLVGASILFLIFMIRKIRHAQLRLIDGLPWLLLSVFLIVISVFPQIIFWLCGVIGIQSPINLVFLIVIFLLLLFIFFDSLKISRLESRINDLAQEVALRDRSFLGLDTKDDQAIRDGKKKDAEGKTAK